LAAAAAMMALRIDLFAAPLFPAVVASLACNRGRVAAALGTRIPYFLGVISFSIYLLHGIFRPSKLEFVRVVHPAPLSSAAARLFALIGSLTVITFAWLAYVCVERPGRAFVRGLLILPSRATTRL
jgi:peptidoglycan/LPS O-acetylase OafA/YrhL